MKFTRVQQSTDSQITFQTYLNYLRQFHIYLKDNFQNRQKLVDSIWSRTNSLQGSKSYESQFLEKSLTLAWNSETVACCFGLDEPDALKIINHWKPIQVYYSIYSCAEALAHLLTSKSRFSHKATLREMSQLFSRLKILPWGLAYSGSVGKDGKGLQPLNFPVGTIPESNLKINNVRPENILATCLRAEHKNRIGDLFMERKGNQNKGRAKNYKYNLDPDITTIFHFVYRLRIRSNYKDVEMFHANLGDKEVIDFNNLLNEFCWTTLCAMELAIIRKVGKKELMEIYERFEHKVKYNLQLKERANIYRGLK